MNEVNIFLVEDNDADVFLIREALDAHEISYQMKIASDGEEALGYISRMGTSREEPCPHILLLDLNIPMAEGADVLEEFRRNPKCLHTPVIIISSSDAPRDREKMMALEIAYYFRKPMSFDAFLNLGVLVKEVVQRLSLHNP